MPLGEMTTTLRFSPGKKQVIVHRATTVENVDDERSCHPRSLLTQFPGEVDPGADGRRQVSFVSSRAVQPLTFIRRLAEPPGSEVPGRVGPFWTGIDRSCRSKLAAELQGDMEKLWSEWDQWGWHRVTFYGDHLKAVERLAALAGFAVVKEC